MARNFFCIALVLAIVAGCKPRTQNTGISAGGPTGMISWFEPIEPGKPSPFDEGKISYFGTLLAIWCDTGSGGGMGTSGGSDGITVNGQLGLKSGRLVDVTGKSTDGKTGTLTINGQNYNLADGRLFLLTSQGDQVRVKQLQRDLSQLKYEAKALQDYGRGDPEIAEFFGDSKKP